MIWEWPDYEYAVYCAILRVCLCVCLEVVVSVSVS